MKLLERDHELASLDELLAASADGQGRIAVVRGPTASGKTALLHTFAQTAAAAGAQFVSATAARGESDLTLGVIDQLFRDAKMRGEAAEHTARLLIEGLFVTSLSEPVTEGSAPPADELSRHLSARVLQGLCQALLGLADEGPVVIGVDDVQNADPASQQCLLYLARRIRSSRILLVLTDGGRPVRTHRLFHAELQGLAHHHCIQLGMLTRSGTTALLAQHLGSRAAAQLAGTCQALSNGNPLLVQSLIEDHRTAGAAAPSELIPGDAYGQAVVNCLLRCDTEMRKVMRGLAALGEQAPPAIVGELTGLAAESVTAIGTVLGAAGLLEDGWFRHHAAQAAVAADLTVGERAAAARVLHNHGGSTLTVARHILAADGLAEPWTVAILLDAAQQALSADDVTLAVNCLQHAYRTATDEAQRLAIRSTLARAEWRINPGLTLRHLPPLIAAVRDGRLDGPAAMVPVFHLLWHGRPDEAEELLDLMQHRRTRPDRSEPESWNHLDTMRWWMGFSYPPLVRHDQREKAQRLINARSADWRPNLQAVALVADAHTPGRMDDAIRSAVLVLQSTQVDDATLPPAVAALSTLIYADQLREAADWSETLLAQVTGRRAPMWEASFIALRALADLRLGNLATAEKGAQAAFAMVPAHCWGPMVSFVRAVSLSAQTARGRYDAAAAGLAVPIPELAFQTPSGLNYLQARGRFYLSGGRSEAALVDFQTCGDLMMKWGLDQPSRVAWRTDAAQAYLALGMDREARKLVEEQRSLLWPRQIRTWGITARVLAATSACRHRPDLLGQAIGALQEAGDRYETAVAMAELSQAYRELGDATDAREAARQARRLAVKCGLEPAALEKLHLDPVDAEPVAPRAVPTGGPLSVLSEAELRVAELAAQGRTNRWIAAELFITVSTVEQHLTRVYRKLRVRRRTDLPAELRSPVPRTDEAEIG